MSDDLDQDWQRRIDAERAAAYAAYVAAGGDPDRYPCDCHSCTDPMH